MLPRLRSVALRSAHASGSTSSPSSLECDACGAAIEGEPAGRGLLLFPKGDTITREEPPLCEQCAHAIGMTALFRFEEEEDEG